MSNWQENGCHHAYPFSSPFLDFLWKTFLANHSRIYKFFVLYRKKEFLHVFFSSLWSIATKWEGKQQPAYSNELTLLLLPLQCEIWLFLCARVVSVLNTIEILSLFNNTTLATHYRVHKFLFCLRKKNFSLIVLHGFFLSLWSISTIGKNINCYEMT